MPPAVIDADILSMFAKIDFVDLLKKLFGDVVMTPKIRDEVFVPVEYGYTFPLRVHLKTAPLTERALEIYTGFRNLKLGKGELEAIAYCKAEGGVFVTNDAKARKFAKDAGVTVISLQALMKALWKKGIKIKEEVKQLLERIRKADNLVVPDEVEKSIFE